MKRQAALLVAMVVVGLGLVMVQQADAANTCPGGTITNTIVNDNVVIGPGQSCTITDSTINGNVTSNGGDFIATLRSTIKGSLLIDGSSLADEHGICATTINGTATVRNLPADDEISFGDDGTECTAPDNWAVVKGNVSVTNNKGEVGFEGPAGAPLKEVIGGTLTVSGTDDFDVRNTKVGSGVSITGNNSVEVESNQIGGALSCSGNTSPSGSGNTASSKSGQCAAF